MNEYTYKAHKDQRSGDGCILADDAHWLLIYISKHKMETQTFESLSDATNIPPSNIRKLLVEYLNIGEQSLLFNVAETFNFSIKVYPQSTWNRKVPHMLIDATQYSEPLNHFTPSFMLYQECDDGPF